MDLQALKKQVEDARFPKDFSEAIQNIIGMAQARDGVLTQEEIAEILDLMDTAIIKNNEESKKLLDIAEAIKDVQDAYIEVTNEEYQEYAKDEEQNQSEKPTDTDSVSNPPTTPPSNPIT